MVNCRQISTLASWFKNKFRSENRFRSSPSLSLDIHLFIVLLLKYPESRPIIFINNASKQPNFTLMSLLTFTHWRIILLLKSWFCYYVLILFEIYFCTNFSIFRTLADDEGLMSELNSHLAAYTFHIFHYFSWRVREKVREGGKHPHYYPSAVSKSPLDCSPPLKKETFEKKNMKILNTITNFFL